MIRTPAGHRLATREARQKRRYRRRLYRYVALSGFGSLQRWQVRILASGQPAAVYQGRPLEHVALEG